jgi:hypothetical protein
VDTHKQDGLFLFKHLRRTIPMGCSSHACTSPAVCKETGLRTSVALMPAAGEPADYTIVNWARWDMAPLRHFSRQLSKRSFWKYGTADFAANRAASMPIYAGWRSDA